MNVIAGITGNIELLAGLFTATIAVIGLHPIVHLGE
jgi:hypothetical protein